MGKGLDGRIYVGLFLSRSPTPRVLDWIDHLVRRREVAEVIVRLHPANTWAQLERELELPGVQVSRQSYGSDIERCDLVIAGNTRTHVDALFAGTSTVFALGIDRDADDALGFVHGRLVYPAGGPEELVLADVAEFYARPGWSTLLRHYAIAWNLAAA